MNKRERGRMGCGIGEKGVESGKEQKSEITSEGKRESEIMRYGRVR